MTRLTKTLIVAMVFTFGPVAGAAAETNDDSAEAFVQRLSATSLRETLRETISSARLYFKSGASAGDVKSRIEQIFQTLGASSAADVAKFFSSGRRLLRVPTASKDIAAYVLQDAQSIELFRFELSSGRAQTTRGTLVLPPSLKVINLSERNASDAKSAAELMKQVLVGSLKAHRVEPLPAMRRVSDVSRLRLLRSPQRVVAFGAEGFVQASQLFAQIEAGGARSAAAHFGKGMRLRKVTGQPARRGEVSTVYLLESTDGKQQFKLELRKVGGVLSGGQASGLSMLGLQYELTMTSQKSRGALAGLPTEQQGALAPIFEVGALKRQLLGKFKKRGIAVLPGLLAGRMPPSFIGPAGGSNARDLRLNRPLRALGALGAQPDISSRSLFARPVVVRGKKR
ncbi:MAG: hypothetical protein H6707_01950 [Deltaproteobacteria bacterium]|nr:hypothetical protein [Deltaproteobacteria bacterium]